VLSPLAGRHNVANALAALAAGEAFGLPVERLATGLPSFLGVKRRLEVRATAAGVTVVDDFAHHPTAVATTLAGARKHWPGRRIWGVFEPRSLTAGRADFLEPYVAALREADAVALATPFHAARLSRPGAPGALDVPALVARLAGEGREAFSAPDPAALAEALLPRLAAGDVVIVMSSGAFGGLCGKLVQGLAAREAVSA
ncbi:MAG TPA: cyanophycin synthetase, partial [Thermoanaerobaculia bacterium]|nr:cyanophycin synthetase [Thermoanaerobaculia bacterium]